MDRHHQAMTATSPDMVRESFLGVDATQATLAILLLVINHQDIHRVLLRLRVCGFELTHLMLFTDFTHAAKA